MSTRNRRVLDRALEAWRESPQPAERLSDESRAAICRAALAPRVADATPMAALFTPTWRLVVAGALPLVLTAAVFLLGRGGAADPAETLRVAKRGDRVIFQVEGDVTVYKSAVPHRFDRAAAVRVEGGTFSEDADAGPRLVFYKIED